MEKSSSFPQAIVDKFKRSLLGVRDFELWSHAPKDNGLTKVYVKCNHCKKLFAGDNKSFGNYTKHLQKDHEDQFNQLVKDKKDGKKPLLEGQQTLGHLKSTVTPGNRVLLDKLIMRYIVRGLRPLSTVEDPDFRQLLRGALKDDDLTFMNRRTLKKKIVEEYNFVKANIMQRLMDASILCLTADSWSSRAKSFLGVTAHFINKDLKRENIILACRRFHGSHTYDKIALGINQIIADFKIPREKVVATINLDNGKNFVKAFDEYSLPYEDSSCNGIPKDFSSDSEESDNEDDDTVPTQMPIHELLSSNGENPYNLPPHIRCIAHTLNLVATTDIKKVRATGVLHKALGKCTKLFNLSSSPKCADVIRGICKKTLKTPCPTRWNSLYDALKHLFEMEHFLDQICIALKVPVLTKKEKEFVQEYILLSEPLANALDTLQGDSVTFLGNLLPAIMGIQAKLLELKPNLQHTLNIANAVLDGIRKRLSTLLVLDSNAPSDFVLAAMSHPYFKLRWIPEEQREGLKMAFIERCKVLNTSKSYIQETPTTQSDLNKKSLYKFYETNATVCAEVGKAHLECLQYLDEKNEDLSLLKKYPAVENMFLRYNTCLPSSASAERLFSAAGLILSPKRSSLGDEIFNVLVFLKCNKNFDGEKTE